MNYNLYVHYVVFGSSAVASHFMMEFLLAFCCFGRFISLNLKMIYNCFGYFGRRTESLITFRIVFLGFYQKRIKISAVEQFVGRNHFKVTPNSRLFELLHERNILNKHREGEDVRN